MHADAQQHKSARKFAIPAETFLREPAAQLIRSCHKAKAARAGVGKRFARASRGNYCLAIATFSRSSGVMK
jgi:hypothetical protein